MTRIIIDEGGSSELKVAEGMGGILVEDSDNEMVFIANSQITAFIAAIAQIALEKEKC
ncbi:hypothetical protein PMW_201 [Pseudomonas phage phiPMW]|uniref:Uncharacterized protein n=1 Tax=Pseudomonas phage phiPMW TaxID=1815582 RepID=A0A1S5R1P8_9CAUD|nr:hypothetical protein FDG97_gp149 [Pseudomonas phage phiPMW]ANA49326.1 hypothetical protein PMW_201 [Pseudomonas phage phiPMW]